MGNTDQTLATIACLSVEPPLQLLDASWLHLNQVVLFALTAQLVPGLARAL